MSDENDLAALTAKHRRLVEKREARDLAKKTAETAEKDYREYEADLFDEMEESDLEGRLKLDLGPPYGVVSFTPRETKFGRIIDADAALEHFEQRGTVDEMTKPTISKRKLHEMVREYLDTNKPLPKGVDFYVIRGYTISMKG